jgi:AraC-like DNA-binding protein
MYTDDWTADPGLTSCEDPGAGPALEPRLVAFPSPDAQTHQTSFSLGPLWCALFSATGTVKVVSNRRRAGAGLMVGLALEGETTIAQCDRSITLRPGQFTFYSAGLPYVVTGFTEHSFFVSVIPVSRIGLPMMALAEFLARGLPEGSPTAGMLSSTLATLATDHSTLSPKARLHCGEAVLDLVQAVLAEQQRHTPAARATNLFSLLTTWTDQHLTEPDLSAEKIAREHHISPRYVRRIFAEHRTSVGRYIRERRLEHAGRDLISAAAATMTVASIARRWCFDDPSVFSRIFKEQYGMTPRAYRQAHSDQ